MKPRGTFSKSLRTFSTGNWLLAAIFVVGLGWMSHAFAKKLTGPIEYVALTKEAIVRNKPLEHIPAPAATKGIYMSSWVAGTTNWREELVRFIDRTELNAIVIDIKDYTGRISFSVKDSVLNDLGYPEKRIGDIEEFINELHAKNIYVIGRIAVFQDPHLARLRPDLAIKGSSGVAWKDKQGISWVDPASREVWDIAIRIGKEA
ncbi:MAG: putative glycoside hydrolase, partial [Patescibacteria group bacterium]